MKECIQATSLGLVILALVIGVVYFAPGLVFLVAILLGAFAIGISVMAFWDLYKMGSEP